MILLESIVESVRNVNNGDSKLFLQQSTMYEVIRNIKKMIIGRIDMRNFI